MKKTDHYLYNTWLSMRKRCSNPNSNNYIHYGARGITVCERWNDFWNFVDDMGDRPDGHTLDRIDNDKDYTPENCRWSSKRDQQSNTRKVFNAKGIRHDKRHNTWMARCSRDGKQIYLGTFDCPLMARLAYEDAIN